MYKEYEVTNFKELCDLVNEGNVDVLAEDLKIWLKSYSSTIESVRKAYPKETKDKKNTEIAEGSFIWVDDGKSDILETIVEFE